MEWSIRLHPLVAWILRRTWEYLEVPIYGVQERRRGFLDSVYSHDGNHWSPTLLYGDCSRTILQLWASDSLEICSTIQRFDISVPTCGKCICIGCEILYTKNSLAAVGGVDFVIYHTVQSKRIFPKY